MVYPTLDEETQRAVNALDQETVRSSHAYYHELLWYGLDAVAHAIIAREALQLQTPTDLDAFLKKYSLSVRRVSYGVPVPPEEFMF